MLPNTCRSLLKLFIIVHLGLCVVFGACQLKRFSSNTALIAGQRLELTCQPEINYIVREWTSQLPFNSHPNKIYTDWSYPRIVGSQRFGYIKENNSVTLYLNSTQLDDAGNYNSSFQREANQLRHYSAQLVVLETEPVCEENITTSSKVTLEEGSIVWMRCSFNFRGNLVPTMEWRQHGGNRYMNNRIITEMVEISVIPNANISSTLAIAVDSSYNATFITCNLTYFQRNNTNSLDYAATNAPHYTYTWNSSSMIVSASASGLTSTEKISSSTFNAIYLAVGLLFGIASPFVALILCLRLRRKKSVSAAIAELDRTEPFESHYDLIPYDITDDYDSIEDVDEYDDTMLPNFSLRLGPLSSSGYAGLILDEPKPPDVYSRMDHNEKSVEGDYIDVDEQKLQSGLSDIHRSKSDLSELSDFDELATETIRGNSYLTLTMSEIVDGIATTGDEMPSAYLKITDDSLQFNIDNNLRKTNHNEDPNSCYLELVSNVGKETEENIDEIASAYLRITDESWQSGMHSNAQETNTGEQISSSYLTNREIDSSASQQSLP